VTKFLGRAIKLAGPAVAGFAAAGPAGAVAGVAAQLAGSAEATRGRRATQERGARKVHKVTAPAAAVAAPTLLAVVLGALGLGAELPTALCGSAAESGALIGALAWLSNQLGKNVEQSSARVRPGA
jgi:Mn2+/Fe2+ NRAMP family transporter